jgi:hypothetical protein
VTDRNRFGAKDFFTPRIVLGEEESTELAAQLSSEAEERVTELAVRIEVILTGKPDLPPLTDEVAAAIASMLYPYGKGTRHE